MSEGKRALITGGAGFVGANLVRLLLNQGYEVVVLDDLSAGKREYLEGLDVEFVEGSILDTDMLGRLVPGCDGVVHLAGQTGVPGSIENPQRDCEVNVLGTLNLLEVVRTAAEQGKPMRVVFASSNAPLGRQEPPATEDKAPLPIAPYGASKLAAEGYCLAYHGSWGIGTVVLRFANLYGPFSGHKESVVAKFLREMLEGREITVDGDGGQTRDFIFVGDLCRAIQRALESEVSGEVFQIATGIETSILELVELLREVVGQEVTVRHGPVRQGDIRKNYSQISKVERMLGWRPEVDLRSGLRETAEWFRKEMEGAGKPVSEADFMAADEADEVAKRLRALGYL